MAEASSWIVPENVTFEGAIALASTLLDQMAADHLSDTEVSQAIAQLVASENGARGFFVTYLSDPRPVAEQASPGVLAALKTAPDVIAPLMVKNLVMSTAMAITHRRNQHEDLTQGSERVQRRSLRLIQQLQTPQLQAQAHALLNSLATNTGAYQSFLERWGYDAEQRQAMRNALQQL